MKVKELVKVMKYARAESYDEFDFINIIIEKDDDLVKYNKRISILDEVVKEYTVIKVESVIGNSITVFCKEG